MKTLALSVACLGLAVAATATSAAAFGTNQGSAYDQLHRDIVIRADVYGDPNAAPRILAAGYGFEGITGIPGLLTENDLPLAVSAGAGVVGQLVGLDPSAPLRNITSGASPIGVQSAGFSSSTVTDTFMDAMPIEFSHPVLPSTVMPANFRVRLNTGEVVTPLYVAQNPNYDFNERQTVVAFGYFGNRLPSSDPLAVHPVSFEVVASATPLQLVTSAGLIDGTGLSQSSNNPYDLLNGPTLVAAKLSRLSLAGDYPSPAFANSVANHGVEYYGTSQDLYRLRLFTSGGFSPNGVSGFEPQDFARFFQLTASGSGGQSVTIGAAGTPYTVAGGVVEVLGIADLGNGLSASPGYTYSEDHDNQFDIIVRASSPQAVRSLQSVVLPDPLRGTHSPIYNPGGPGTDPVPGTRYTQPSPGQTIAVAFALADPATVSWAAQSLAAYDQADDLAVAFRLRNPSTGEWQLTSSSADAVSLVNGGGWQLWDVPFATNANDSYVVNVVQLSNDTIHDTVYTANPSQIAAFEQAGYVNDGSVFTAYDQLLTGLDPVWLMRSPSGQHAVTSSPVEYATWRAQGWSDDGVAFYTVRFPNAVPEPSTWGLALAGFAGGLPLIRRRRVRKGTGAIFLKNRSRPCFPGDVTRSCLSATIAVRDAVQRKSWVNLIHMPSSYKVDVFVSRERLFDLMAMERATAQPLGGDEDLMIPVATAEDSIVAKLEGFRLTNETSERQWDDVSRLVTLLGDSLDTAHMERMAASVGVADLLHRLLKLP